MEEVKKRKYNKSGLKFSAKTERYKVNSFKKNIIEEQKDPDEKKYIYFIRPFITCWRVQQLLFEVINSFDEIPSNNEGTYPRYVLHDLVQTWIGTDSQDKWFDREDVWNLLKEDVVARIQSTLPTKALRE